MSKNAYHVQIDRVTIYKFIQTVLFFFFFFFPSLLMFLLLLLLTPSLNLFGVV